MIPRVGPVPLAFLQCGQRPAWVDPGRAVSQRRGGESGPGLWPFHEWYMPDTTHT